MITQLVFSGKSAEFDNRLNATINDFEIRGLTVEVQFGGQDRGGTYSALVIGR